MIVRGGAGVGHCIGHDPCVSHDIVDEWRSVPALCGDVGVHVSEEVDVVGGGEAGDGTGLGDGGRVRLAPLADDVGHGGVALSGSSHAGGEGVHEVLPYAR